MRSFKILIASLILIFVLGNISLGQEISEVSLDEEVEAGDLGISEPRLLPDSPFYFLKSLGRGIKLFFTFNRAKKAELRLKFANEKILEVKKLAELKRTPRVLQRALEGFQKEIEEIEKFKGEELKQFSEKLTHQQLLHQRILQRLETQVPPEVFQKIREHRERHLEKFKDVMLKLESRDKIADRLESDLEKLKGSKFKEFKNLEILEELKEKMPEDVKQTIEERQATIIENFVEKLEAMSDEEKEAFKNYLERISGNKLKHLEVITDLEREEISDKLKEITEKVKQKKIEGVEEEYKEIAAQEAEERMRKASDEIVVAEEKIKEISEEEYGRRAAKRLLELAKQHLERAKTAYDEGRYGRVFGLATAAYYEALNVERIVEKIGAIKQSPEKIREKIEKLYPGVELPEDISHCKIPLIPSCPEGKVTLEKTPEGCPALKCTPLPKPVPPEEKIACITLWDPVCGKDGKTYSNECFANVAGVEINHKGVCRETKSPER